MRKINPQDFEVARQTTSRDINRRIALNLVRAHQPISRADLAREMNIGRGVITVLTNELIADGLVYEGATGKTLRGRKPTFLYVRTEDRLVLAVDVRLSRTFLMLLDFAGRQIALETFSTVLKPEKFAADLAERVRRMLAAYDPEKHCEGIGVVVPGIVEARTGRVLLAPTLGWREVALKELLTAAVGLEVHLENAPKACALAQMWLGRTSIQNFVYVSVSDGVGVGVVTRGELVRGRDNLTGEFGHIPLSLDGPVCLCGRRGCWEAYVSNLATVARYFGEELKELPTGGSQPPPQHSFSINDVVARARSGDEKAVAALRATARYLGLGLAMIINALNPEKILLGGEITTAWDLIGETVRESLATRTITDEARDTSISIAATTEYPRLMGAAALVIAPNFAALKVA